MDFRVFAVAVRVGDDGRLSFAGAVEKLCWTWDAAAYVVLPAWFAFMTQVPTL